MPSLTYVVLFGAIAAGLIATLAAVLRWWWPESQGYRRVGVVVASLAALYVFWLLTAFRI